MKIPNPAHSEETVNRARMLIDEHLYEEALTWLTESLQTDPNQRLVWHFLFETLAPKGNIAPILNIIQDVIVFIEDPEATLLVMAQHMQLHGFHDEAVEIFNIILHYQSSSRKTFEELLLHQHLNGFDDESAFAAYYEFNRRFAAPITAASTPAATEKIIGKPLKLGFVSRDFASGHSLKAAMAAFFARPEGRNDRYILYSSSPPEQQVEEFFRDSADEFSNVFALDDMELANRIRSDEIDVLFGTFAKSMASIGAFVCSTDDVINYLAYNMRSQIFAKSLPMPFVIGGLKRLELLKASEQKDKLWKITNALQSGLKKSGFNLGNTNSCVTPVMLNGTLGEATNLTFDLRENYSLFCSIVVYPVVPKDVILLRLIPTASHSLEDVDYTINIFNKIKSKLDAGEYHSEKVLDTNS